MLTHDRLCKLLVVLQVLVFRAFVVLLLRYHVKLRHGIRDLHVRDVFLGLVCNLRSWCSSLVIKFVQVDDVAYLLYFVIRSDLTTDLGLHA